MAGGSENNVCDFTLGGDGDGGGRGGYLDPARMILASKLPATNSANRLPANCIRLDRLELEHQPYLCRVTFNAVAMPTTSRASLRTP